MEQMEAYFAPFREQIIGYQQTFRRPYGEKRIVYAACPDASGQAFSWFSRR